MTNKRLIPLPILVFLLAACSGVMDSAQPSKQYYMLSPLPGGSAEAMANPAPSLTVSVSAVPGLDTDRIQALSGDASLDRYANARWPDHLPEVLGSVMKRSLADSGGFSGVQEGTRASGDGWLLQLEVQQFYGLRSGGATSTVVVEMAGSIQCGANRGKFTLSSSNSVGEERLALVVAAHQRGLDDVTRQLLKQIKGDCS